MVDREARERLVSDFGQGRLSQPELQALVDAFNVVERDRDALWTVLRRCQDAAEDGFDGDRRDEYVIRLKHIYWWASEATGEDPDAFHPRPAWWRKRDKEV